MYYLVVFALLVAFVVALLARDAGDESPPAGALARAREAFGETLLGRERTMLRLCRYALDGDDPNANVGVDVDAAELARHGYETVALRRAVLTAPAKKAGAIRR